MAVTVWSARYGDDQMRALAAQLRDAIAEVTDVSEVTLIGGRPRQLRVDVDPARLAAYGLDPLAVQRAIVATNARGAVSGPVTGGHITGLEAGTQLKTVDEVRRVVVSASGHPVFVSDLAKVVDGDAEPTSLPSYVSSHVSSLPELPVVRVVRRTEPVPIGLYAVVPDDGDSSQGWCSRVMRHGLLSGWRGDDSDPSG